MSYSVKDIADMLQTNPETVRRWIRKGKLKASKGASRSGGSSVSESDFLKFLSESPKYFAMAGQSISKTSPAIGVSLAVAGVLSGAAAVKLENDRSIASSLVEPGDLIEYLSDQISQLKGDIEKNNGRIKAIREENERFEEQVRLAEDAIAQMKTIR